VKKPANITYGVEDRPPISIVILSGLQNVAVMAVYLILPLIICRQAGASIATTVAVLSFAMLVMGIATLLQLARTWGVGSGYLIPAHFTGIYASPSLVAAETAGLPLVFGMTAFAGLIETGLSRILNRLRPYFPPEIAGLVVMLVGVTNAAISVRYLAQPTGTATDAEMGVIVAVVTLGSMVALNVWTRGTLRMICALIGIVAGYILAVAIGLLPAKDFAVAAEVPIFALPQIDHLGLSFDIALVMPFLVSAIAATLKAMAVVSFCQKINDAEWIRPDLNNIRGGVAADGLGTIVAGILGTFGVNASPSCVGLSAATGVTARTVAYAIAAIFAISAFLPGVAVALAIMPKPVIAAALMFTACFLLINGMQLITSRMLDSRKTFVVGLTIVAGLAIEIFPHIADFAPPVLKPILGSSLVFGTVLAFTMNIVFRLGLRQKVSLLFDPAGDDVSKLDSFLDEYGAKWGARRDIISRAGFAIHQAVEAATDHCNVRGPIRIDASFDEFNLDLTMTFEGDVLELPEKRPSEAAIRQTDDGIRLLAGFMLRRNADRVHSERIGEKAVVRFHFDH
jgi:NCS2 family nucleobase:cation symporter-2